MLADITFERAYVLLFPMSPSTDRFAFGLYLLVVHVGLRAIRGYLSSTSECLSAGHAGQLRAALVIHLRRALLYVVLVGNCFDVAAAFDTVDDFSESMSYLILLTTVFTRLT